MDTPLYVIYDITIDVKFFNNQHGEELPLGGFNENDKENNEMTLNIFQLKRVY